MENCFKHFNLYLIQNLNKSFLYMIDKDKRGENSWLTILYYVYIIQWRWCTKDTSDMFSKAIRFPTDSHGSEFVSPAWYYNNGILSNRNLRRE